MADVQWYKSWASKRVFPRGMQFQMTVYDRGS